MNVKIIGLVVVGLLVVAFFGITAYIAYSLTLQAPSPLKIAKSEIGDGIDVAFKTSDNLTLKGWYFKGTNGKALMFVHGAGSQNRANEVYGTPSIAKYYLEDGFSILLFDLRGTGESDKARISFGDNERYDVAAGFEYLKKLGYQPGKIGIISDSLGAIATIMGGEALKESGGIVLDSPASTVRPVVSNIMEKEHSIPPILHSTIYLWAKILFKVDVDSVRPIDHIATLKNTPILFLHGEEDTLIPPQNTLDLLSHVDKGIRVTFPNTKHVETYITNPDLYKKSVSDFFTQNLK